MSLRGALRIRVWPDHGHRWANVATLKRDVPSGTSYNNHLLIITVAPVGTISMATRRCHPYLRQGKYFRAAMLLPDGASQVTKKLRCDGIKRHVRQLPWHIYNEQCIGGRSNVTRRGWQKQLMSTLCFTSSACPWRVPWSDITPTRYIRPTFGEPLKYLIQWLPSPKYASKSTNIFTG